jgi:hypothetical protein
MSHKSSSLSILLPDDIQYKIFKSIHQSNEESNNYMKYYEHNSQEFLIIHIEKLYEIEEYKTLLFMNILCNNQRNNIFISTNIFNNICSYLYDDNDAENIRYKQFGQEILKEFLDQIYVFFTDNYISQSLYVKLFQQIVKESEDNEINFETTTTSMTKTKNSKENKNMINLDQTFKDKLYTFFKIQEEQIKENKKTLSSYYNIHDDATYKTLYVMVSEKYKSLYINLSFVFSEGTLKNPKHFILSNIHTSDTEDDVRAIIRKIAIALLKKTEKHYVQVIVNKLCKKFNVSLNKK